MCIRFLVVALSGLLGGAPVGLATAAPDIGNNVITVQTAHIGSTISVGATVVPYKEVTLSAQLPGRVAYIAGEEGDAFEKGAVLVALNDDELLAQRRAALADWANADSALRAAGVQYTRELYSPQSRSQTGGMGIPSMFDQVFTRPMQGMIGQSSPGAERGADLYSAGSRIEQARNALYRSQSQLQVIDAKLRDSKSLAPMNGVIIRKFVEVGDTVQPGQPLLEFADIQYLQIRAEVPARVMAGLRKGMMVPAKLDVGNTRVSARVAQIFPMADPERHTVTVKFDLPKSSNAAPGMYAEVRIPDVGAPSRNLPVIPRSAIRWRGSLPGVYVINEQGEAELRLIRVGDKVDANTISVLSGLRPGERILASPDAGPSSGWSASPGVESER